MNKTLKTVLFTLLITGLVFGGGLVIFLRQMKISPIFIEREWRERFDKNYWVTNLIFTIPNDTRVSSFLLEQEQRAGDKKFGTYFDRKWDYLIYNDSQKNYVDYNTITGGRVNISVPKTERYEIGISVCQDWILNCETKYYKNPVCIELIYVPKFYERKREMIVEGCETIDVTESQWDKIFFSVKY